MSMYCCTPRRDSTSDHLPSPLVGTMLGADKNSRVPIPSGMAQVGTDHPIIPLDGEGPARYVKLRPFWIDRYSVTTGRFHTFVAATNYITDAERFGWSFIFRGLVPGESPAIRGGEPAWWKKVEGASWRHPDGSVIRDADYDLPATHISWNDASAFAGWSGGRLPRECEWEHAARGGFLDLTFPWGNDEPDESNPRCNIWRGVFPIVEQGEFHGPMPVDAYEANGFGVFNMCGNVWEWTADPFRIRSLRGKARSREKASRREQEHVLKGGSFLCHKSYCFRYRIAARTGRSRDTSAAHTGFRLAYDAPA